MTSFLADSSPFAHVSVEDDWDGAVALDVALRGGNYVCVRFGVASVCGPGLRAAGRKQEVTAKLFFVVPFVATCSFRPRQLHVAYKAT